MGRASPQNTDFYGFKGLFRTVKGFAKFTGPFEMLKPSKSLKSASGFQNFKDFKAFQYFEGLLMS